MKRILLTAFEPFDQRESNQSSVIAHRITTAGVTLLELPVTFQSSFAVLQDHLKTHTYDVIIALGEGPNRTLALEHVALNVMHARIPDNAGVQPLNASIDPDLPLALPSRLPLSQIATVLDQHHLTYHHSYSAGTYVCNDLFFRLMASSLSIPCGFLHVPHEVEQEAATLASLQCLVTALSQGELI